MRRSRGAEPPRDAANLETDHAMREVALVGGIFLLALLAGFVPFFSVELALILSVAAGTSIGVLLAQVVAAAAAQMIGKSCFFLGGRSALTWWNRKDRNRPNRLGARLLDLLNRATRRRRVAAATVFVSASTGLPPFAVVSALAGGWRLRLSSFIVMGFAGKSARFAGVLLVPGALAAFHA
jgi:membrane protein YqaA with SNARE-associated domain